MVVPAPFNSEHRGSPFRRGAEGREWQSGRAQLLFFKGQLQWGGGGKAVLEDGRVMYSHGVRQAVAAAFGCGPTSWKRIRARERRGLHGCVPSVRVSRTGEPTRWSNRGLEGVRTRRQTAGLFLTESR